MTWMKDIRELKAPDYLVALFSALAIVGPGVLCIAYFWPAWLRDLDVLKLGILSASLTLPLSVANFALVHHWFKDDLPMAGLWATGTMLSFFVAYFALAGVYYYGLHEFRLFAAVVLAIELVMMAGVAIAGVRRRSASPLPDKQ